MVRAGVKVRACLHELYCTVVFQVIKLISHASAANSAKCNYLIHA